MSVSVSLQVVGTASQSGALTRALNIGIVAACFGIFVSLSDFVISAEKKKKIDIFIDGLTLRLDYTKTFDWLQRWLRATRRASIASTVFGTVTVLLGLATVIGVEWTLWANTSWWKLIGIGAITLALWSWQWTYVSKAYENVGVPIIGWFARSNSYAWLIGGYFAVIVVGIIVLVLCLLTLIFGPILLIKLLSDTFGGRLDWLIPVIAILKIPFMLFGGNFVFGLFLCWIGIIIDGVATMIGAFFLFVARILVESAGWIMWQISSYPKGALTATLTLIGAALTVAKIFTGK